jgi:hypothetical protein
MKMNNIIIGWSFPCMIDFLAAAIHTMRSSELITGLLVERYIVTRILLKRHYHKILEHFDSKSGQEND